MRFKALIIAVSLALLSTTGHALEDAAPIEPWQYNNGIEKADDLAAACAPAMARLSGKGYCDMVFMTDEMPSMIA